MLMVPAWTDKLDIFLINFDFEFACVPVVCQIKPNEYLSLYSDLGGFFPQLRAIID